MLTTADINLLLLTKPELLFFGLLAAKLDKKIIKSKDDNVYAYTDGKMICYVLTEDTPLNVAAALTIHEILHIISLHFERKGNRNLELWNVATDHVVNRFIKSFRSKYIKLPDSCVYFKEIELKFPEISAEQLYDLFPKEKINACNQQTANGSEGIKVTINGKEETVVSKDLEQISPEHRIDMKEAQNLRALAQSLVLNEGYLQGMGNGPKRALKKLLKVVIPWHEILALALKIGLGESNNRTWSRKNLIMPRLKVPGYLESHNAPETLIISMDTSGSISPEQLAQFASTISQSSKYYKKVIILLHHHAVYNIGYFDKPTKTQLFDFITHSTEWGGTSHVGVFECIQKIIDDGSYLVSSILLLTDYESDVEQIFQSFKWIFEYDTIWLLTGNSKSTVKLKGCKTTTINIRQS